MKTVMGVGKQEKMDFLKSTIAVLLSVASLPVNSIGTALDNTQGLLSKLMTSTL